MNINLLRDARYAVRMLLRSPGFTALAILTLALGIGANTAIFSVFDAVLLRPLPIPHPERVMVIHDQLPSVNLPRTDISATQYLEVSHRTDLFASAAALSARSFNLVGQGAPQRVVGLRMTASAFPLFGMRPELGRFYTEQEDQTGGPHVVLLSDGLWRSQFAASPAVLGMTLDLNGDHYEVIGVMPPQMNVLYPQANLAVPAAFTPQELSPPRAWSLAWVMLTRLRTGVSVTQAQSGIASTAANLTKGTEGISEFHIEVRPLLEERVGDVRGVLWMLLGAVLLVLLIACVNIANLLLARSGERSREMAIRLAMGAPRVRIVGQLLTESMLLGVAGGTLGLVVAWWGIAGLHAFAPKDLLGAGAIDLDWAVLGFTLGVSLLAGALFGLAPALQSARGDLNETLKESGRSGTAGRGRQRLRRVLVVAEVALALVLVVCSGLLLRSFARILDVNPGFDAQNLLTMQLSLPRYKYGNEKQLVQFSEDVLRRVSALPGVTHAALAFEPPFVSGDNSVFAIRGYVPGPGKPEPHADYLDVSSDYLATMKIPLLRGRWFTPEDYAAMQKSSNLGHAVVIDQAFAERFWPGADPIGGGIGNSDKGPFATIVGVVATVHGSDLAEESKGTIYIPDYSSGTSLALRTAGAPGALANSVREQVAAVDPEQPIYDVQTMEERISQSLARRRFAMVLLAAFAALAFLLALIGLEGVIAYIVTQRTHEIGIRMALGAQRRDVMSDVLGQGIKLAGAGVAIGLIGTALCSRLMASQLFGVPALDWVTYLAASAAVIAAASLACYLPARRATRVDPIIALRYE